MAGTGKSRGPVRTQMTGKVPSTTGVGGGIYGHNKAPFDKPQSMGGGGIPTKFFDAMPQTKAKTLTPTQTANVAQGTERRPGTKQYAFGKSKY